jgi:hypothetical protein
MTLKKTYLNKRDYLPSQPNNQYPKLGNFQSPLLIPLSLPTSPTLQFQSQQKKFEIRKDSAKQKTVYKDFLDNTKENIGKHMDDATIIQYPFLNTDTLIGYYKQSTEPIREISLNYLKLQKEYINAFQPSWVQHIENSVNKYLAFQNKMIVLYTQICNSSFKNINMMENVF